MKRNNYFDKNIKILKFSGLWVPSPNKKPLIKSLIYVYNIFNVFYPVVFFTILEFLIIPTTAKDLNDLMKNLNMASNHLFTGAKIFAWFYYRKEVLQIIEVLHENSVSFEAFGDFKPEQIIEEDKKVIDRFTLTICLFGGLTSITAFLRTFAILLFDYKDQFVYEVDAFNVTTRVLYNQKLPYYSYIFWDYRESRWHFGWAALFQCYPVFYYGIIVTGFDTLYAGIICYLSSQLKILKGAFKTVRPRCLKRLGLPIVSSAQVIRESDWVNKELNKELTRNTKALQVIFTICEKLEDMFSYVILVQVSNALLVFCSCLYLISSLPITDERVIVESVFMVAIEIQFFMYCYFGNHVTLRSDELSLALFEGDWLSTDAAYKRSMLITMSRMKRPIFLTIGKFSPLTLATFVTIGRASYSFFAVLRTQQT